MKIFEFYDEYFKDLSGCNSIEAGFIYWSEGSYLKHLRSDILEEAPNLIDDLSLILMAHLDLEYNSITPAIEEEIRFWIKKRKKDLVKTIDHFPEEGPTSYDLRYLLRIVK